MSEHAVYWLPVDTDGRRPGGDTRDFLAAAGTTVTAEIALGIGADPWYAASEGAIYAYLTPETALTGRPSTTRLVEVAGRPASVAHGMAAFFRIEVLGEAPRSVAYGEAQAPLLALLETLQSITGPQITALVAARHRAKPVHWNAAWRDAWEQVPSARRALVLDDVRAAARDGARLVTDNGQLVPVQPVVQAAEDAARALLVRHLIGTGTFKAAHYDARTRPWRTAVGPLHPADDRQVLPTAARARAKALAGAR